MAGGDAEAFDDARFIMLRNGRVFFEGRAADLRAATDPYLKTYLSGWVPPLIDEEPAAS